MVFEQLSQAMGSADVCLVLITPASGERPWIQFEAGEAYFGHKRIYPLLHPSAKSPHTLPNEPILIGSDEEVAKLIDALRADLKLDAIPSTARTIQAVSRFIGEVKAYNPEYTILHCENRLELQIGYGDVLEWPGPGAIALTCDDRFDLVKHGEGSQLYERALIGQFRRRFFNHLSTDEFRAYMVKRLGGKLEDRFEVGHVSVMSPLLERATDTSDRRMLFLVVLHTVKDRGGVIEAAADAPDVWRAYENLWGAASVRGRKQSLSHCLAPVSPAPCLLNSNRAHWQFYRLYVWRYDSRSIHAFGCCAMIATVTVRSILARLPTRPA